MNFVLWIIFLGGCFNVAFALSMKTKNFTSSLVFKILPFIFGMVEVLGGLQLLGYIEFIK